MIIHVIQALCVDRGIRAKSAIANIFVRDIFIEVHDPTIGPPHSRGRFLTQRTTIRIHRFTLSILDMGGQDEFKF